MLPLDLSSTTQGFVPSPPSWVPTVLYDPRAFITHTALLRQAFAHCAKFPTAASRRSLDRVSVPVWLIILSDQLSVFGLVGRYPTNNLMDADSSFGMRPPKGSPTFPTFLMKRGLIRY